MEPTENKNMNDQQFDALLRHALLNDQSLLNDKNLEQMATHILSPNTEEISVPQNDLVSRLTKDLAKSKFNWRMNLLIFTGIISLASLLFLFRKQDDAAIIMHGDSVSKAKLAAINDQKNAQTEAALVSNPLPVTNPAIFLLNDSTDDLVQGVTSEHMNDPYVYTRMHIHDDMLHYENVPTLTDDQIAKTKTDKMKMLKDIAKKKTYGNLGNGKTLVDGVMTSVSGFSIENAEVSNLEYRTFLNDLVIQGKFDDYLAAAPVAGLWKAIGLPEFEDVYFTSEKYNNFPAVNISRKGAEKYCEWLTAAMKEAITKKDVKWSGNDMPQFSLPTMAQWIYAARGCDTTAMKYPWGKYIPDSLNNKNGCFLCDFNWTVTKDAYTGHHVCEGYKKLNQGGFHHAIISTAGLAIDTLLTCPVYSYNPNTTGQYNMLGDVSEMVWAPGNEARSMGGNWNSSMENTQIEAVEQYIGMIEASPMIGFRPVMNGHYNYGMIKQIKP